MKIKIFILVIVVLLLSGCSSIPVDKRVAFCESRGMSNSGTMNKGFVCSISDLDYTVLETKKNYTSNSKCNVPKNEYAVIDSEVDDVNNSTLSDNCYFVNVTRRSDGKLFPTTACVNYGIAGSVNNPIDVPITGNYDKVVSREGNGVFSGYTWANICGENLSYHQVVCDCAKNTTTPCLADCFVCSEDNVSRFSNFRFAKLYDLNNPSEENSIVDVLNLTNNGVIVWYKLHIFTDDETLPISDYAVLMITYPGYQCESYVYSGGHVLLPGLNVSFEYKYANTGYVNLYRVDNPGLFKTEISLGIDCFDERIKTPINNIMVEISLLNNNGTILFQSSDVLSGDIISKRIDNVGITGKDAYCKKMYGSNYYFYEEYHVKGMIACCSSEKNSDGSTSCKLDDGYDGIIGG